jgi:hypothetical protein
MGLSYRIQTHGFRATLRPHTQCTSTHRMGRPSSRSPASRPASTSRLPQTLHVNRQRCLQLLPTAPGALANSALLAQLRHCCRGTDRRTSRHKSARTETWDIAAISAGSQRKKTGQHYLLPAAPATPRDREFPRMVRTGRHQTSARDAVVGCMARQPRG